MKLILDTHVLLWWLDDLKLLSIDAQNAISDPNNDVFVSSAVLWEIATKHGLGKLSVSASTVEAALATTGFKPLAITFSHAIAAGGLPLHHRDPFDRMLIAQTIEESSCLVTRDASISQYSVSQMLA